MEESVIRGLVVGVVFAVIAFVASNVWKLSRSRTEVARRIKIVAGVSVGLVVLSMMYSAIGPGPTALWSLAGGAMFWIMRGKKFDGGNLPRNTEEFAIGATPSTPQRGHRSSQWDSQNQPGQSHGPANSDYATFNGSTQQASGTSRHESNRWRSGNAQSQGLAQGPCINEDGDAGNDPRSEQTASARKRQYSVPLQASDLTTSRQGSHILDLVRVGLVAAVVIVGAFTALAGMFVYETQWVLWGGLCLIGIAVAMINKVADSAQSSNFRYIQIPNEEKNFIEKLIGTKEKWKDWRTQGGLTTLALWFVGIALVIVIASAARLLK